MNTRAHISRVDNCQHIAYLCSPKKVVRGVTLIETIIYIALFGLLIGGAVVAAFNLLEANTRAQTKVMLQEEGGYLFGKIMWTLSGARFVTEPIPGGYASSLVVTKWDAPTAEVITLSLASTSMTMSTGGSAPLALNNSNVTVTNLFFSHTLERGIAADTENVQFSFGLSARAPNGMIISLAYPTTTVVLRR